MCCPGVRGGRSIAPGVRLKRGAGAGCVNPVDVDEGAAGDVVRMRRAPRSSDSTGAKQTSVSSISAHHSSRVLVLEDRRRAAPSSPATVTRSSWSARSGSSPRPDEPQQLGVELRLDRADGDVLAVAASRRRRRSGRRCRACWCRARPATMPIAACRGASSSAGPRRRPWRRRPPGPGRCAAPSTQRADDAEGQEHAAAAEVADEVERRHGRPRPCGRWRASAPVSAM